MAKVTNPLFGNFIEAVSNIFVFQNNGSATPIARIKRRKATNPRSAHVDQRAPKWATAVAQHQKDAAPNEQLTDYVSRFALSPDRPTELRTNSLAPDPQNPERQIAIVSWTAPTTKYNGWPLDNLTGYFVETSPDLIAWTRRNAAPITTPTATLNIPLGDVYFFVLAVDDVGNVSSPSEPALIEIVQQDNTYDSDLYNNGLYL